MAKCIITIPVGVSITVSGGGNSILLQTVALNIKYPIITLKAGIKGDKGDPAGNLFITAPIDLGGNRVVMADGNYADNTNVNTLNKVIGITKTSALLGAEVEIVTVTELNGFSGLSINEIVYLSTNGTITQILPVSGYIQQIGIATSSTKILINISSSINR